MQKVISVIKEAIKNIDPMMFACTTLLSIISIVTVWGAVDNFGMSKLKMQVFIFIIGIFVTFAIAFLVAAIIYSLPFHGAPPHTPHKNFFENVFMDFKNFKQI